GDRVDRRPRARTPAGAAGQGWNHRDQLPEHRVPGPPLRWLQAVGFRTRERARDTGDVPRDEERPHLDRREAGQPVGSLAGLVAAALIVVAVAGCGSNNEAAGEDLETPTPRY